MCPQLKILALYLCEIRTGYNKDMNMVNNFLKTISLIFIQVRNVEEIQWYY